MKLGQRIRELRTEQGWRLSNLSEHTNISAAFLSDIERGRSNPSMEALCALATAFGISVRSLLSGVDFVGTATNGALPAGVAELQASTEFGVDLTPAWVECLSRIEYRGKRLRNKTDALEVFLHLRRVLERVA